MYNRTLSTSVHVSVVIPCYDCGATIERAVMSVAAQTCRPTELILVLDGPDDGLLSTLQTLARKYGDSWIHIVTLDANSGPSAARNAGWDIASQRYIAFLDADDAWHPRKIEIQLEYMETHREVCLTGHRCRMLTATEAPALIPEHYRVKHISIARALLSNPASTPSAMVRRELPFRFATDKRYSEDYLLWLQILSSGYSAAVIDLELAYLFKTAYGEGGLSGRLWKMEKGELDTYRELRRARMIALFVFWGLILWSLAKYVRRIGITWLRNQRTK